jgi:hypothetical protein
LRVERTRPVPKLTCSKAGLSRRGQAIIRDIDVLPASRSVGKAFRAYEPGIDLFPVELWSRVAARVLRRAPRALYGQGNAGGYVGDIALSSQAALLGSQVTSGRLKPSDVGDAVLNTICKR